MPLSLQCHTRTVVVIVEVTSKEVVARNSYLLEVVSNITSSESSSIRKRINLSRVDWAGKAFGGDNEGDIVVGADDNDGNEMYQRLWGFPNHLATGL